MLGAIFHGILVGLLLAVMIGPVFLALMSVTITKGKKKAYRFMIGNGLSDMLFAILSYKGLMALYNKNSEIGFIIGLLGAALFLFYGIFLLTKKEKKKDIQIDAPAKKGRNTNILILGRGFLMNTLNPGIAIFWIAVVGQFVHRTQNITSAKIRAFMIAILVIFIITDIIKINSADYILKKLTVKNVDTAHTVAGILLLLAGAIMLVRTFI